MFNAVLTILNVRFEPNDESYWKTTHG